jgi:hypothetical protein
VVQMRPVEPQPIEPQPAAVVPDPIPGLPNLPPAARS